MPPQITTNISSAVAAVRLFPINSYPPFFFLFQHSVPLSSLVWIRDYPLSSNRYLWLVLFTLSNYKARLKTTSYSSSTLGEFAETHLASNTRTLQSGPRACGDLLYGFCYCKVCHDEFGICHKQLASLMRKRANCSMQ